MPPSIETDYAQTLESFLQEANLTEKSATTNAGDWTLEKLIEEKIQFDTSLNWERRPDEVAKEWSRPAPSIARSPELSSNTNILCVRGHSTQNLLSISTADNTCTLLGGAQPYEPLPNRSFRTDGPVVSTLFTNDGQIASTTMSGKLLTHDVNTARLLSEVRHHTKWVVNSAFHHDQTTSTRLLATAGWDQKVNIYILPPFPSSSPEPYTLPQPSHTISLPTNPESLVFVTNPDTKTLNLLLSRRDSTFLHYYTIDLPDIPSSSITNKITVHPAGTQNLAPHSNAWATFTPSHLSPCPVDPTLLAIATSHLPHLKLLIVRLLFPGASPSTSTNPATQTPASLARASLALQDVEDQAITLQVSTMAPQTPYSTPQAVWRPDGSGVWVNGDDGVVRGVEVSSGKVVAMLRGHEVGSKVRTLWAGCLGGEGQGRREVLVSGGFDKKVFVWEVE